MQDRTSVVAAGAGGLLFFAPLLLILFRRKYPRWWFDWNRQLQRFGNRAAAYLALMDDRYPSTDEHQSVHLDYPYPNAASELNRWLPLVKWFLAIPHYVVLFLLDIAHADPRARDHLTAVSVESPAGHRGSTGGGSADRAQDRDVPGGHKRGSAYSRRDRAAAVVGRLRPRLRGAVPHPRRSRGCLR